jgi:5-methylcytosine-specific restriction endonuclease McrA
LSQSYIPTFLRRLVIRRAQNCCEYCGLSQVGQEATFHIDHIVPISPGGKTVAENLALACVSCSPRKNARTTFIDPDLDLEVRLLHPRQDAWTDHFAWKGVRVIGITSVGKATIAALDLNRALILAIREEESKLGRHPG